MNLTPKQLHILTRIRELRMTRGYSPTMQELADEVGVSKVTVFEHVEALIKKGALLRDPNKARSLAVHPDYCPPHEQQGIRLPLVGTIAAGSPIEAIEDRQYLDLESLFSISRATRANGISGDVGRAKCFGVSGDSRDTRGGSEFDTTSISSHPTRKTGGGRTGGRGSSTGVGGGLFVLKVKGDSMIDEQIRDGDYVVVQPCDNPRNGQTVVALLDDGEATLKLFYKEKNRIRLQPANDRYDPIYATRCKIQGVVVGVIRTY